MIGGMVAPCAVPAVFMMHITARTLGRVTSGHGDFGRLAGQESFCLELLDRIASIGAATHFDALVVVGGTLGVPHPSRTGVLPLSRVAPQQRQRNQSRDRGQTQRNHRLTASMSPRQRTAGKARAFSCAEGAQPGNSAEQGLRCSIGMSNGARSSSFGRFVVMNAVKQS
jgi:hypothetical protein